MAEGVAAGRSAPRDADDWRHDRRYGDPRYRGKRKKSFLEDLFD